MTDIPKDIQEVATTIADGWHPGQTAQHAMLAGAIERAILAERERAADIALSMDADGRSNWGLFTARRIRDGK